jgi:hypothetical protein
MLATEDCELPEFLKRVVLHMSVLLCGGGIVCGEGLSGKKMPVLAILTYRTTIYNMTSRRSVWALLPHVTWFFMLLTWLMLLWIPKDGYRMNDTGEA